MKRKARYVVREGAPEAVYHLPLGLTKKRRLPRSLEYWCSMWRRREEMMRFPLFIPNEKVV
jgi:hypothetical protein